MKQVRRLVLTLVLTTLFLSGVMTWPAVASPGEPAEAPQEVRIGVFITQLFDFDMMKRAFSVTFWGWQIYDRPDYQPLESIEIFNAKSVVSKYSSTEISNGRYWSQAKYSAVMMQDWDIAHYPFDRQKLNIIFEEALSDAKKVRFVADKSASKIDQSVGAPGWKIEDFSIRDETAVYQTTYGDPSLQGESAYSRVVATLTVKREGWRMLASLYVGFFVAFILTFLTYLLDYRELVISRIGLCAGAVFAAVGNKYVIDNLLPPASGFTLSDMIEITTFVGIIASIVVLALMEAVKKAHPTWPSVINRCAATANLGVYVGLNGWAVLAAAAS